MKRVFLLSLAIILLVISGCSGRQPLQPEQTQVNRVSVNLSNVRTTSTVVSCLPNESGTRLVQSSREMVIPEGQQLL